MEKIASFTVNHEKLKKGLYVSRIDSFSGATVTTFDLRFTAPNVEKVIDKKSLHTIEHLGATYLRNSSEKEKIVYFGPMGCRTGFYLIVFGKVTPKKIYPLVKEMLEFIVSFNGEIPGAKKAECGNYKEQNLKGAKKFTKKYLDELIVTKRFKYEK